MRCASDYKPRRVGVFGVGVMRCARSPNACLYSAELNGFTVMMNQVTVPDPENGVRVACVQESAKQWRVSERYTRNDPLKTKPRFKPRACL